MIRIIFHTVILTFTLQLYAQDSLTYKLILDAPVFEFPQNVDFPQHYPSMNQTVKWSSSFYELGYWGIDELGDKIFYKKEVKPTKTRKMFNGLFKYAVGLGFAKYGSELPIPLGVWGHEEFHRTTLAVGGLASKNGNWVFHRWDGTVYGVSDTSLDQLKATNTNQLLYSYVAGVQYETYLNQQITINDFYKKRSLYKNSLLLYNAYYVYNYFHFSTSSLSDSVKVIAPQFEDSDPALRDYAGADLTSWVYDMYYPELPFTSRDSFPNGDGVNRRIGFSDLPEEAQKFLKKQKNLSLINFINPAIFMVNRIRINEQFAFNIFPQYVPTHYGSSMAIFAPLQIKQYDLLVRIQQYENSITKGYGLGLSIYNYRIKNNLEINLSASIWDQPTSFRDTGKTLGGAFEGQLNYLLGNHFSVYADVSYKTAGWQISNPYLSENFSVGIGGKYKLFDK